jgi:hypothetical protein
MIRTCLLLSLAGVLVLVVGCAGIDDKEAQSEFEKLRGYPTSPQGDRILPDFESVPPTGEGRFA